MITIETFRPSPPHPALPHEGGGFLSRVLNASVSPIHDANPPPSWGRAGWGGATHDVRSASTGAPSCRA